MKLTAHPAAWSGNIGWHPLLLGWAVFLLIPNLLTTPAADPLPELGLIRRTNSITWTDANQPSSNFWVSSYGIWIGDQFEVINIGTNALAKLGEVSQKSWPGANMELNGRYGLALTCVGSYVLTNVSGSKKTVVTNLFESDFSEIHMVDFVNGVPVPPGNVQLFTVMQVMATNNLPAASVSASSVPIPAAMEPPRAGPEYELSGR